MAQLLVRNLPESLVKKLKKRAVEHGWSAEEEHRRILEDALEKGDSERNLSFSEHLMGFAEVAPDVELELPPRTYSKHRDINL